MYVYCVERFAHIQCYSDCSRREAIWLNPFVTLLFSVCNAVNVHSCILYPGSVLYPCCVGVWYVYCYVRKTALLHVFTITEMRDMDLYEVPWTLSLLGFVMGTMLASCVLFLNMLVRNASPRGAMCFRCLMVSLSEPCEILFLLFHCCVADSVGVLFGETIHNIFGCGCYFVVKCYGSVEFG